MSLQYSVHPSGPSKVKPRDESIDSSLNIVRQKCLTPICSISRPHFMRARLYLVVSAGAVSAFPGANQGLPRGAEERGAPRASRRFCFGSHVHCNEPYIPFECAHDTPGRSTWTSVSGGGHHHAPNHFQLPSFCTAGTTSSTEIAFLGEVQNDSTFLRRYLLTVHHFPGTTAN